MIGLKLQLTPALSWVFGRNDVFFYLFDCFGFVFVSFFVSFFAGTSFLCFGETRKHFRGQVKQLIYINLQLKKQVFEPMTPSLADLLFRFTIIY